MTSAGSLVRSAFRLPGLRRLEPVARRVYRRARPVVRRTANRVRPVARGTLDRLKPVPADALRGVRSGIARGRRIVRRQRNHPAELEVHRAGLTSVRWVGASVLEISGWAYLLDEASEVCTVRVAAVGPRNQRIPFQMRPEPSDQANVSAKDPVRDRRPAGFVATADLSTVVGRRPSAGLDDGSEEWRVLATVGRGLDAVTGPFRERVAARMIDVAATVGAGVIARPHFRADSGLTVRVRRVPAEARDVAIHQSVLRFTAVGRDERVRSVQVRSGDGVVELSPVTSGSEPVFELDLSTLPVSAEPAQLSAVLASGTSTVLSWPDPDRFAERRDSALPHARAVRGPDASFQIRTAKPTLTVTGWSVTDDPASTLVLHAEAVGFPQTPTVELTSPLQTLTARASGPTGTVQIHVGLSAVMQFASTATAPRPGGYEVLASAGDDEPVRATVDPDWWESLPAPVSTDTLRFQVERGAGGGFLLRIAAPHPPGQTSRFTQRNLVTAYKNSKPVVTDSVYFECFHGRLAGDNTLPIHDELTRRRPDLARYWVVGDYSVEIPEGATPILMHSERWLTELARARYVVTNCTMRSGPVRWRHQTVLQAWHGTPFKRLGLDRHVGGPSSTKRQRATSAAYDMLISQNPYSSERFRSAWLFPNTMLEIGYPRNDVLVSGVSAERMARVRESLGLREGERVVLYMPTWRDDSNDVYAELDYARLLDGLGDSWRLLVRGHPVTHGRKSAALTGRVGDVTLFPDTAELYLVADVLITDYSSAMFDFTVTGKPIVFFVPDIAEYTATNSRGAYFSLPEQAPGPCVGTTDEVIEAIGDLAGMGTRYADLYRTWRETYNPWDDGKASVRAVDALLEHQSRG